MRSTVYFCQNATSNPIRLGSGNCESLDSQRRAIKKADEDVFVARRDVPVPN